MAALTGSKFFFLKNATISSAASSCGSRMPLLGGTYRQGVMRNQAIFKRLSDGFRPKLAKVSAQSVTKRHASSFSSLPLSYRSFARGTGIRMFSMSVRRLNTSAEASMKQFAENTKTFAPKGRAFPVNSWRISGLWLVGSAGLVFGIVVLGGLTRLTESGLSITEWKPVTGSIPPLNQADWEAEFERYKDSPEFKLLNSNITLDEFKFIYFMEWAHRLWGRAIGLTFVIPAAYFVYARKVSGHTARRLLLISGLIGLQGFIGWWMVKSGLNQDFLHQPGAHPRVSQYRLATHLGAAFLVYIAMFNTGMDVLRESKWVKDPIKAVEHINILKNPALRSFRLAVTGLAVLAFITSMSGAFVAGLDAGLIYNSFPYMGERIVPPKSELMDPLYASDKDSSWNVFWKNMFENPTTVQFNHRVMAVTTFTATFAMHMWSLKLRPIIPRPVFRAGAIAMSLVTLQAALGITTLVYVVPISAAAAHQANALALLTSVLVLAARLRLPRAQIEQLLRVISKNAKPNAQTVLKP